VGTRISCTREKIGFSASGCAVVVSKVLRRGHKKIVEALTGNIVARNDKVRIALRAQARKQLSRLPVFNVGFFQRRDLGLDGTLEPFGLAHALASDRATLRSRSAASPVAGRGGKNPLNGVPKSGVRFPRESPANLLLSTPTGQMTEVR
jgi:hypothetical protein